MRRTRNIKLDQWVLIAVFPLDGLVDFIVEREGKRNRPTHPENDVVVIGMIPSFMTTPGWLLRREILRVRRSASARELDGPYLPVWGHLSSQTHSKTSICRCLNGVLEILLARPLSPARRDFTAFSSSSERKFFSGSSTTFPQIQGWM